ncbi:MAG: hypothetical protein K8J31_27900 [Anaerolineae bacterium]|nr:hypothetical protein [Anaerolineae bacterium]
MHNRASYSWARLVSDLLSPPVVWAAMAFPIAFRDARSQQQALTWALMYGTLVCLMPMLYVGWMVRRGTITDLHMQVREQRIRPFLVSMGCTTIAWWVLRFLGAPPVVPLFALFSLIQLMVMAAITLVWQISVHAMSITGAMVAAFAFFGPLWAILIIPLIVLVGAARLKLQRHTLAQVIAGAALGLMIPVLLFTLF